VKVLRGSALNPFGYHGEARLHRDLLAWYEAGLTRAATACSQGRIKDALAFVSAPDDIRGYGPVRTESSEKARRAAEAALA
jgi:indolepyruvate ferredoxin oxidoreductase